MDHEGRTAGDATAERMNFEVTGVESSDSANPTGTTRAATSAARNRTRYRFLMGQKHFKRCAIAVRLFRNIFAAQPRDRWNSFHKVVKGADDKLIAWAHLTIPIRR